MLPDEACRAWTRVQARASLAAPAGSLWPLRASLAASDRSLEVPRAPKVERQGCPGEPDKPFSTIRDQFWLWFSTFFVVFDVPWRGRLDSLRTGPNLVFAGRRSTLEGSQARQNNVNSKSLDRPLLGRRFASEPRARSSPFSVSCASQPRCSSPRLAPRRSKALLVVPRGDLGDPLVAAGAHWGCPKTCLLYTSPSPRDRG